MTTAPVQRRVETLEAEAFRAGQRHDEIVAALETVRENQQAHATAIATSLEDTRDLRAELRDVRASLARLEAGQAAILAHLGIPTPAAEDAAR